MVTCQSSGAETVKIGGRGTKKIEAAVHARARWSTSQVNLLWTSPSSTKRTFALLHFLRWRPLDSLRTHRCAQPSRKVTTCRKLVRRHTPLVAPAPVSGEACRAALLGSRGKEHCICVRATGLSLINEPRQPQRHACRIIRSSQLSARNIPITRIEVQQHQAGPGAHVVLAGFDCPAHHDGWFGALKRSGSSRRACSVGAESKLPMAHAQAL
jgi:hypothetical protein